MARRALLTAAMVSLLLAADAPTKDEPAKEAARARADAPAKPAELTWAGPPGGKWSEAANWKPARLPGLRDTVIFDGALGKNTASIVDRSYHVAKLEVRSNYTQKITLENDLVTDVLDMEGGTIDGSKRLIIWQRVVRQIQPTTRFETSFFTGGMIKANTFAYGERDHPLTLVLAKNILFTPHLEANLTVDAFTQLEWKKHDMAVGGGKAITVYGWFHADSPGTIGNTATNWDLNVMAGGSLSQGQGKFDHGTVQNRGGAIYLEDVRDTVAGGGRIFKKAAGPDKQDEYAKVELKGVLSEGPFGPEFTVGACNVYNLDLSKKPKLKGESLQKLYGRRGVIVAGMLYPSPQGVKVQVLSVHVEVTEDE